MNAPAPLIEGRGLTRRYPLRSAGLFGARIGVVPAVTDVSISVSPGETLALVGESGSGKSTLGRLLGRLEPADSGRLWYDGAPAPKRDRRLRRDVQYVFQDPDGSLSPRLTAGAIIAEPLAVLGLSDGRARAVRVAELLAAVGLEPAHAGRYPHEFSGGQRQRIAIARALAPAPRVIIADEPVSALDVSVQGQVLNLMADLKARHGHAYLLITHDLAVVDAIADRVAVMYFGRLVEMGPRDALFTRPAHPYTRALLDAVPRIGAGKRQPRRQARSEPPSPLAPPAGCAYHPRCPFADAICRREVPALTPMASGTPGHVRACHHAGRWPEGLGSGSLAGAAP
ncbi:MAG: ATP-binding cassette domain-containing protein [Alphaproteobacteria bacterium]|nr:ATP-binding cassette domain-containing protein [Alphaproteobacteria bacterium]